MPENKPQHILTNGKNRPRKGAIFTVLGCIVLLLSIGFTIKGFVDWQKDLASIPTLDAPREIKHTPTAEPVNLNIPSLKINAPFVPLGLNLDHTLEVPKGDQEVGWFIYGAKPGDTGPAVVVGHLDSPKGPAIFANLKKIKPGDIIEIQRADGSSVKYKVDSFSNYSQDNFPTQAVYGPLSYPGLRLITCFGTYNKKAKHYSDNLIVFASLVQG